MLPTLNTLIGSGFTILIAVVAVVCLYQVFLSDWIENMRSNSKESKSKTSNLEKIAQVKLVSDNTKGIETFIIENAQYLSDQMVKKLVARIEYLNADKVIAANENTLSQQIESLELTDAFPEEEEKSSKNAS